MNHFWKDEIRGKEKKDQMEKKREKRRVTGREVRRAEVTRRRKSRVGKKST